MGYRILRYKDLGYQKHLQEANPASPFLPKNTLPPSSEILLNMFCTRHCFDLNIHEDLLFLLMCHIMKVTGEVPTCPTPIRGLARVRITKYI
jgi:hypothetical protein